MGQMVILDSGEDLRRRRGDYDEERKRADFVHKIENLRTVFDPVEKVFKNHWARLGETVAYGTPGMLATSAMASNPITRAALFMSLTEDHYQSLLAATEGRMGYEAASRYSAAAAPFGAALETVSEYAQSSLLRGKLPFFDKVLTGAMDGITNRFAR